MSISEKQMKSREIGLVPVGEVPPHLLEQICAAITVTFARACRIAAPLPEPEYALDARRRQYSAGAILQRLRADGAERVLGIVDLDLFVPDLNFVFGLSDPQNRRAVIALPRLQESWYGGPENERLFVERAIKEAVHELGHTYGLGHCTNPRCVMAFSNSLTDTDHKARTFCPNCQKMVRQV